VKKMRTIGCGEDKCERSHIVEREGDDDVEKEYGVLLKNDKSSSISDIVRRSIKVDSFYLALKALSDLISI